MDEQIELLRYIYEEDLYVVDEPQVEKKPIKSMESPSIKSASSPPVVAEPKAITFFGENQKGILILVNDPSSEFLNIQDLDFLMKIIEAGLKFSKKDIALANLAKYPANQVMQEVKHDFLISFGGAEKIADGKPMNEPIDLHGKKTLFSHQLREISIDVEKKKLLWKALQSMFKI